MNGTAVLSRETSQRGSMISVTPFAQDSNTGTIQPKEEKKVESAIKFQDSLPVSDAESDNASQSSSQGSKKP